MTTSPRSPSTVRRPLARHLRGRRGAAVTLVALLAGGIFWIVRSGTWNGHPSAGSTASVGYNGPSSSGRHAVGSVGDESTIGEQSQSSDEPLAIVFASSNERFHRAFKRDLDLLDPHADGWDTEAFSDLATAQLEKLGELIVRQPSPHNAAGSGDHTNFLSDAFSCAPLRPTSLRMVYSDGTFSVSRTDSVETRQISVPAYRGAAGLSEAIEELTAIYSRPRRLRTHFKIISVEASSNSIDTAVLYDASGAGPSGVVQQTAEWRCRWTKQNGEGHPKLQWIGIDRYEEVLTQSKGPKLFADVTHRVLQGNESYRAQLLVGNSQWNATLDWRLGLDIVGTHGLAIGDVNGDGLDDVYVCEPGGLPNRLFIQQADGTAVDASEDAGVDWLDSTYSALLLDIDNDGDEDLAMACGEFVQLLENDGKAHFTRRRIGKLGSMPRSMAAADFDLDGDIDIYVCGYFGTESGSAREVGLANPMPYHDANNGGQNLLLRNEGDWKFTDVTAFVGLDANNTRFSYAASWEDYDNDGDPDLYVANDFGRNNLYRNDGGRFVDVAAKADVEDVAAGMSVSWGDYNHDGLMDLYVGNMFSSAGNRVAYQRQFKSEAKATTLQQFRRHARGNTLFENAGDGTFRDVSIPASVNMGRWAWGSVFVDINNDGWEDLLVANGMITGSGDKRDL